MKKNSEKTPQLSEIKMEGLSTSNQQLIKGGNGIVPLTFKTPTWKYIASTTLGSYVAATDGYIDGVHVGAGYEAEQI